MAKGSPLRISRKVRNAGLGYLFLMPFIIGLIFLFMVPLVNSIRFSFSELVVGQSGYTLESVGWQHYDRAINQDLYFTQYMVSSFFTMATQAPIIVIFSFFVANLLNRKFPGRAAARSILFLPVVMTTGVIMALESNDMLLRNAQNLADSDIMSSMAENFAVMDYLNLTNMMVNIGLPDWLVSFITTAVDNIYTIVVSSGVQIIIFLAGLQSISPSLYESASVEGAVGWEAFWKITFPMMKPLIGVNTLYTIINFLVDPTNDVMLQIQDYSSRLSEYGLSSAMAWIYFVPILILLGIVGLIMSRRTFYYD